MTTKTENKSFGLVGMFVAAVLICGWFSFDSIVQCLANNKCPDCESVYVHNGECVWCTTNSK